jgi:hypothetical protein
VTLSPRQKSAAGQLAHNIRVGTHNGERLLAVLMRIAFDEQEPSPVRLQAIGQMLDRGFGKAPVILQIDTDDASPLRRFTLNELLGLEAKALAIDAIEVKSISETS